MSEVHVCAVPNLVFEKMDHLHNWMIFLLFIMADQQVMCVTFHIVPSPDSPCPGRLTGEPCLTLQQYTSGEYRLYVSDPSSITLEFQPGRLVLGRNDFIASNLDSFVMTSVNSTSFDCTSARLVEIKSIQNVRISGIRFSRCRCRIESATMVTLKETSFQRNTLDSALYVGQSSATVIMCLFSDNNQVALRGNGSSFVIDQSTFMRNGNLRGDGSRNSAVLIENGQNKTVTVTNSNFTGNVDSSFYGMGALSVVVDLLEVFNTTFVSNAGTRVGALSIQTSESSVTLRHCSFINNKADYRGGAVFTMSSISIYQSKFIDNIVTPDRFRFRDGINGGAVYLTGANSLVSIHQSTFMNNTVDGGNGGAIYVTGDNASISIYQSALTNNTVTVGDGGAVYIRGDNSHIVTEQSSLTDNNATGGSGGAVYSDGRNADISITETTFSHNLASTCGALDINDFQHYSVRFDRTTFTYNTATSNRGGVMCIRNASISVLDSTFSHNRATGNAGVFSVDDSDFTIRRATFDNNTVGANGGVIATEFFRTTFTISQASFTNNRASESGGVMYVGRKGSQVKVSRSAIDSNYATRGGVIAILGSSLEITRTNIFDNTADKGEDISACNSDVTVSEQLLTSTDPVYSVCTLFDGDINETSTTPDLPSTTSRPLPDTTTVTSRSTTAVLPTEPSNTSVYFELNGEVYLNNSVVPLLEVGEDDSALLCKTDLTDCCGTPPNRFGHFYYPSGVMVPVRNLGHSFYRNRGVQEVRLNRREGATSPAGKFRCEVPDAKGTTQNQYIDLVTDE